MRNVSAGIIIFIVVISLGVIIFFEFFDTPKKDVSFEYGESSSQELIFSNNCVIESLDGILEKKEKDDLGWTLAKEKEVISDDVQFRTKEKSRAFILFENGVVLRLDEQTQAEVEFSKKKIEVKLIQGEIYSRMDEFENVEYSILIGNHKLVPKNGTLIVRRDEERNVKLVIIGGEVEFVNEIKNSSEKFYSGNSIMIFDDRSESKEITKEDVSSNFFVWSVGQGRQREMIDEIDRKEEEEKTKEDEAVIEEKI
ncbi:MAG: FecR domain-containing protein [Candidatus Moranbacteria bacterium]|nr:FecR domain-containing protein [Candidatus Moranbacteria bacterium]